MSDYEDPNCSCLWSPVTGRIHCDYCKQTTTEKEFFSKIIQHVERNIEASTNPDCFAANRRALRVLRLEAERCLVMSEKGSAPSAVLKP